MSVTVNKITAIVLAAGLSTRMGQLKQLLPYNNKTVISSVVETLLDSQVDKIIVVTGHESEQIKKELSHYTIKIVYNANYTLGMHTSVISGVDNIYEDSKYFMIVLGDQPHISTKVINQLIKFVQNEDKDIIIPSYNNKRGHPIMIHTKYIPEILKIGPDLGLKRFILDHDKDIEYLNIDEESILDDMDTPQEYKTILNKYGSNNNSEL